jgi:hypothetical protein
MKARKQGFNEGIINWEFATNSRELKFAKTQQSVSMVK